MVLPPYAMRVPLRPSVAPLLWALVSPLACTDCERSGPEVAPKAGAAPLFPRVALPGDALRGLSGLTPAPPGAGFTFLSVAERLHHLIPIRLEPGGVETLPPRPIVGVDADLDVEGLAFIDDATLVFATEADHEREAEQMLFARWSARDGAEVFRVVEFDYDPWGIVPDRNRGLEGICATDRHIVAASEMVGEEGRHRWSPVATFDRIEEAWTPFRVFLTSDTGKLSGLSCRPVGDEIEVTAIERHFDLLHVVRFRLAPSGGDVQARTVADLRPGFTETPPNFEGFASLDRRIHFLITDNDWRGVRGPTELIRWIDPEADLAPAAPRPAPAALR